MKMKRFMLSVCGLILLYNCSFAQYTLEIEILGIRNDKGNIMLQLFDENQKVLNQVMGSIKDNRCLISIKNLSGGKYAVRYYHDENLNRVMETNLVGKPTEGYGFSNNVTGKFGPPAFGKWFFMISEDKKIELRPSY